MKYVEKVLFTDKYGVTETKFFRDQIPYNGSLPPKFLCWDCKLWEFKGMGITACFYHEVKSFVQV